MSNIVEFPFRRQLQSAQNQPDTLSESAGDTEIHRLLERELEKMIKATSFLETLRAELSKET